MWGWGQTTAGDLWVESPCRPDDPDALPRVLSTPGTCIGPYCARNFLPGAHQHTSGGSLTDLSLSLSLPPPHLVVKISIFDMNMRPGASKFPRPDGKGCVPGNRSVPCSHGTSNGRCTPDIDCVMGTNPGRTHRFYTGTAVRTLTVAITSTPALESTILPRIMHQP
jgi:hypothetical protein